METMYSFGKVTMVPQLFCSMCSAFVLQILKSTFETRKAGIGNKYSGLINFGEFKVCSMCLMFINL